MSVERSFEAWEEVQRHGQDLADKLAQGFTGLIQINSPSFPWPPNHHHYKAKLFDLEFSSQRFSVIRDSRFGINQPIDGVSAILDIWKIGGRWDWKEKLMKHIQEGNLVPNVLKWNAGVEASLKRPQSKDKDYTPMFPSKGGFLEASLKCPQIIHFLALVSELLPVK